MTAVVAPAVTPGRARRNVAALAVAQVLGSTGIGLVLTISTITASELSGSDLVAALAQTSIILGSAAFTIPVARVAERWGRRRSLAGTYLLTTIGLAIAAIGIAVALWPVMFVGLFLAGAAMVAGLASRFAAADSARSPAQIPTFIALVMWASTVGSILGPNLIGPLGAVAGVDARVLAFALAAVFFVAGGLTVWLGLRDVARRTADLAEPDAARTSAAAAADAANAADAADAAPAPASRPEGLPLAEQVRLLRASPGAVRGIVLAALSHMIMVGLMGLAPVEMHHGGVEPALVGVAMSSHLAGMYALSPLVGIAVARFGTGRVAVAALVTLAASGLMLAITPRHDPLAFTIGLFVLGVAWSIGLIAGSTLVTSTVPAHARIPIQGLTDFAIALSGALASVTAGVVVASAGYPVLAWSAIGLVAIVAVGLAAPGRRAQPDVAGRR